MNIQLHFSMHINVNHSLLAFTHVCLYSFSTDLNPRYFIFLFNKITYLSLKVILIGITFLILVLKLGSGAFFHFHNSFNIII